MLAFLFVHQDTVPAIGAVCFGLVLGWYAWVNVRRTDKPGVADIATFAGAVGGAALIKLFPDRLFGYYCIGLAVGFFACFVVAAVGKLDGSIGSDANPNPAPSPPNEPA